MHIYAFGQLYPVRPGRQGSLGAPVRRVYYMHIKDALADGTVVPAGKGIGCLPELLKDFSARGGEAITLEPPLQVFKGLSDLEKDHKTPVPRFAYPTSDAAFDAACQALKALL